MYKTCCLAIVVSLSCINARAQEGLLNGFINDSITHLKIRGAKVFNSKTRKTAYTNSKGFFRIGANFSDTIIASLDGYITRTVIYSPLNSNTINLFLSPVSKMLPTVSVSSRYNQYQLDSMNRKRDFEQMRGGRLTSVSRAEGFGIALNLDRVFKKRYKYQKRNEKLFNEREKDAYVAYRYSPQLVSYYTGLKGKELEEFMRGHTPSYEWLRKHTRDEDVFFYINEHVKLFRMKARKSY